jgi:hypothetical protein
MKRTDIARGQNAEFGYVETDASYSNHSTLKE